MHRAALGVVLQKASSSLQDQRVRLHHRLRALDRENLSHPELPQDFDTVAYLLLNPDVLESDIPVVHHFLSHGKREGRSFRL